MRGPGAATNAWLLRLAAASFTCEAAGAEELADQGHAIASTSCATCHLVEGAGSPLLHTATARPFATMAKDSDVTSDGLRARLAGAHADLPLPPLTREEIEALAAYIGSLRAQ